MMTSPSSACPRCETPVSIGGGRCPTCGFEIPAEPRQPSVAPPRPGAHRPVAKPKGSPATLAVTAVLIVAAAGLVVWRLRMDTKPEATASSAVPVLPTASVATAPKLLEPTAVFGEAKKRALTWNSDALLVAIDAHAVVTNGQIDVEHGGSVELEFAKPIGAKLVPGEKVDRDRFVVRADAGGMQTRREQAKTGGVAAGDPNCTLDAAWSKGVAAGLPSTRPLDAHYAWDPRKERSVWAESAGDDASLRRTLDGWTCAVVVR